MKFYKCSRCGNFVALIHSGGGELVCCGEPMKELVPNTVDASNEKHVPVVQAVNGKLIAKVGAVAHPMEEKHYIEWILFDDGKKVTKFRLSPGEEPAAEISHTGKCEVYAYCNLHGLWKTNFS